MKYLIVNGSPHKENTWKVVLRVKKYLLQWDESAQFEELHLAELKIPFCCGCSLCFRKGGEYCPHYSIIEKVTDAMDHADGVIVASTTYNMRETALLKNFFDHLCYLIHRPQYFQSKALVITTTGGVGDKQACKSVAGTLRAIGFNSCYTLPLKSLSWNAYTPDEKAEKKCRKAAYRFYKDVSSKKLHFVRADLLIPYNLFRGMSLSYVKGTEFETEDGNYWTDPMRINRVYDHSVPVFFLTRFIGHIFYLIGKIAGKKINISYKK